MFVAEVDRQCDYEGRLDCMQYTTVFEIPPKSLIGKLCCVLGVVSIQCLLGYIARAFAQPFLDQKGVGMAMRD